MAIQRFTRQQFENTLTDMAKTGQRLWQGPKVIKGEYVYTVKVKATNLRLVIRSSVDPKNGMARVSGQDSIRVRVQYQSARGWQELTKLAKKYTTRETGWQERLKITLRETYILAIESHKNHVAAMTNGQSQDKPEPAPKCPKCGAPMVERKRKRDGHMFLGCSKYFSTKCKGSRPIDQGIDQKVKANTVDTNFVPTPEQKAVFAFIVDSKGNLVVEAVAGSGKTTTIVEVLKLLPRSLKIAFLAFNVKIKNELAKRAPDWVSVSTINSLGNSNVINTLGRNATSFDEYKAYNIFDDLIDNLPLKVYEQANTNKRSILRLVDLLKANLLEPTPEILAEIAEQYGIETNDSFDLIVKLASELFYATIQNMRTYDYSDQVYWCAVGLAKCETFDIILIDEAQDLNKAQIEMVLKSIKSGGRIIAVGDRFQSIYGFRGADTKAIPNLIEALNASTLPLSVTWRCPKSHVRLAQELVPHIIAAPNAIEGVTETIKEYQALAMYKTGDLVLCRTNAPLVEPAMELIRAGIKAIILGKDIGKGLVSLIDKMVKKSGTRDLDKVLVTLRRYAREQAKRLIERKQANRATMLKDRADTIDALALDCPTVTSLKRKINKVFSDQEQGVVFSSVHKAKGSESHRVFILKPELMPHPKATNAWQLEQEKNLEYVALTRAKHSLYFVETTKRG